MDCLSKACNVILHYQSQKKDIPSDFLHFLCQYPSTSELERKICLTSVNSILSKRSFNVNVMHGLQPLTALQVCTENNNDFLLNRLLKHPKIDVDEFGYGTTPPIITASLFSDSRILKKLVDANAKINVSSETGQTPLYNAINTKNASGTKILLDCPRTNVNYVNQNQYTALHMACAEGSLHVVETLLKMPSVDVNLDAGQGSPLYIACMFENHFIVEKLVECPRVEVNQVKKDSNESALFVACRMKSLSTIQLLLQYGADTSIQNFEHHVCSHDTNPEIQTLIRTVKPVEERIPQAHHLRLHKDSNKEAANEHVVRMQTLLHCLKKTRIPSRFSGPVNIASMSETRLKLHRFLQPTEHSDHSYTHTCHWCSDQAIMARKKMYADKVKQCGKKRRKKNKKCACLMNLIHSQMDKVQRFCSQSTSHTELETDNGVQGKCIKFVWFKLVECIRNTFDSDFFKIWIVLLIGYFIGNLITFFIIYILDA